jgi:hypothetical protein
MREREIDNYMTPAEAAFRWGVNQETVKNKLKPSITSEEEINRMIDRGLIKYFIKPGGTRKEWILSKQAMYEWFGKSKEEKEMEQKQIQLFFETDTYSVDRGYVIHVSRDPRFATEAVVEDGDGRLELVDASEMKWEDFDGFIDCVLEKYEGGDRGFIK